MDVFLLFVVFFDHFIIVVCIGCCCLVLKGTLFRISGVRMAWITTFCCLSALLFFLLLSSYLLLLFFNMAIEGPSTKGLSILAIIFYATNNCFFPCCLLRFLVQAFFSSC
eukprot:gene8403-5884_t